MEDFHSERAIERQLKNYCRSMDRCELELGRQVFFADAQVDYGAMFKGSGHAFVEFAMTAHLQFDSHLHRITNALIDVNGDTAISETYVEAQFRATENGAKFDIYTRGRYLDRWERREGVWAIAHRHYVNAMAGKRPIHDIPFGVEGTRDTSDPSYELFARPAAIS